MPIDQTTSNKTRLTLVAPSLRDPRIMNSAAVTLWVILGQTVYFFNRSPVDLIAAIGTACALDFILGIILFRLISLPLSAYLTGISIVILVESNDWRVYVVASIWGILSKYLIRDAKRHFFNPSNFAIVMILLLGQGVASISPGSQWGADYRIAVIILCLGLLMMWRVHRLDLAFAWLSGYVFMGLVRMALGQGGLVFVLGPMTGAEFALFTFVMMPDPKTSPPTSRGRIGWGISIAVMDGVLRYFEIRYSMFFALFTHTAILPIMHWVAARAGLEEASPWRLLQWSLGRAQSLPP
jgi:Na+-translocating ferredoxin:NAD+ oxidoreductase RnfD subunit